MHTVIISKFSGHQQAYVPVQRIKLNDEERDQVQNYFESRPTVEGFYQYLVPLPDGSTLIGYSINPDVLGYMNANWKSK